MKVKLKMEGVQRIVPFMACALNQKGKVEVGPLIWRLVHPIPALGRGKGGVV